ncbi:hypothetical protein STEG23_034060 [Scotinomys teguina]
MSFITYSTDADTLLPLTSDREAIHSGLLKLQKLVPEGRAFMHKGFMKANKSRRMGAAVYTMGVHEYDKQQDIIDLVSKWDVEDWGDPVCIPRGLLDPVSKWDVEDWGDPVCIPRGLLDPLVSRSCSELLFVQPSTVCIKDSYKVKISGHGFGNLKSPRQVLCRFTFNDNRIVDKAPIGTNGNTISCPGPMLLHPGEKVSLGISLNNGLSFIGNKLILTGTSCENTGGGAFSGSRSDSTLRQVTQQEDPGPVPGDMKEADPKEVDVPVTRSSISSTKLDWPLFLFLTVMPMAFLLLLYCCWRMCFRKRKKRPRRSPPPKKEPEEKDLPPPSTSPPAPPDPPPPAPPSANPNPTLIVAYCDCGKRTVQVKTPDPGTGLQKACSCTRNGFRSYHQGTPQADQAIQLSRHTEDLAQSHAGSTAIDPTFMSSH